jgi:hypothetical protein
MARGEETIVLVFFFILFICSYNIWVISPPFPPPPLKTIVLNALLSLASFNSQQSIGIEDIIDMT